ncbi:MAG: hypothetical protein RJA70_3390 [Pseudomonadota bacterium]|jgi:pseudouridine-5'-monophosphatase
MQLLRRPKAAIFDLDGVLLDTEPLYTLATQRIVRRYDKVFGWDLKARTLGGDAAYGARLVIDALELPMTPEEYLRERVTILRELFVDPSPIRGAPEWVSTLKSAGMKIAVGTSSYRELCDIKWRNHPWLQEFAVFVCGDDKEVRACKPSPDIFLTAARRLNVPPADCVVFEDSPAGVTAARSAGMQVIALPDPALDRGLVSHADLVLGGYGELSLATLGF